MALQCFYPRMAGCMETENRRISGVQRNCKRLGRQRCPDL